MVVTEWASMDLWFSMQKKRDFFPNGAKWKFKYPSKLRSVCLILKDETGHKCTPETEQCLDTVAEIGTVEGSVSFQTIAFERMLRAV